MCSGHINIEDISSDFDDVQELRIEDDRAPTNQHTPNFSSTNSINKEQASKFKEKESDFHESILHFILSSQKNTKC